MINSLYVCQYCKQNFNPESGKTIKENTRVNLEKGIQLTEYYHQECWTKMMENEQYDEVAFKPNHKIV